MTLWGSWRVRGPFLTRFMLSHVRLCPFTPIHANLCPLISSQTQPCPLLQSLAFLCPLTPSHAHLTQHTYSLLLTSTAGGDRVFLGACFWGQGLNSRPHACQEATVISLPPRHSVGFPFYLHFEGHICWCSRLSLAVHSGITPSDGGTIWGCCLGLNYSQPHTMPLLCIYLFWFRGPYLTVFRADSHLFKKYYLFWFWGHIL